MVSYSFCCFKTIYWIKILHNIHIYCVYQLKLHALLTKQMFQTIYCKTTIFSSLVLLRQNVQLIPSCTQEANPLVLRHAHPSPHFVALLRHPGGGWRAWSGGDGGDVPPKPFKYVNMCVYIYNITGTLFNDVWWENRIFLLTVVVFEIVMVWIHGSLDTKIILVRGCRRSFHHRQDID